MPRMNISVSHDLEREEAKKRLMEKLEQIIADMEHVAGGKGEKMSQLLYDGIFLQGAWVFPDRQRGIARRQG